MGVISGAEWVTKAAHAAALVGPEPAEALRLPLAELARRTRWSEAALDTVTGRWPWSPVTRPGPGHRHLLAAEIYASIPAVTDRVLALALACWCRPEGGATARRRSGSDSACAEGRIANRCQWVGVRSGSVEGWWL